jgi:DNA-binding beta-propeller fold protein YncE
LLIAAAPSGASVVGQPVEEHVFVTDLLSFNQILLSDGASVLDVTVPSGRRATLTSNGQPDSPDDLSSPTGLAFEPDGDVVVVDYTGIVRVDRPTGTRTAVTRNGSPAGGPSFANPDGIAVAADGSLLVADYAAGPQQRGAIIRVDPVSGVRSILSRNDRPAGSVEFNYPTDLAIARDGTIYVVDTGTATKPAKVVRVDPQTGARTLVSKNGSPSGGPDFIAPWGIELDREENLLISDPGTVGSPATAKIIRVDARTGARSLVSKNSNPTGAPEFGYLGDLALDRTLENVYTPDYSTDSIYKVNLASGARTSLSTNTAPQGNPPFGFTWFGIAVRGIAIDEPTFRDPVFTPGDLPGPLGPLRAAARTGTQLSYQLEAAAKVRVRVDRLQPGRVVGATCVAATKANSKSKPCNVVKFIGNVDYTARKGKNRHVFTGVVNKRALNTGSYRATLFATAADGRRSVPVSLPFRIR